MNSYFINHYVSQNIACSVNLVGFDFFSYSLLGEGGI